MRRFKIWLVNMIIDRLVPFDREFRWRVCHDTRNGTGAGVERLNDGQLAKKLIYGHWDHDQNQYEIRGR